MHRKKILLSGPWQFQVDIRDIGENRNWYSPDYEHGNWGIVPVPKAWDCFEEALWGFEGVGWYKTTIPPIDKTGDSVIKLQFGRVHYHAKVWLNGVFIGEHCNGYVPFEFDVSSLASSDNESTLIIRVDNRYKKEWLPGWTRVEWIQYGGILQSVHLLITDKIYISDLTLTSQTNSSGGSVDGKIELTNTTDQDWSGNILMKVEGEAVLEAVSVTIPAKKSVVTTQSVSISEVNLWSPDNPHLYSVTLNLFKESEIIDSIFEKTGIRTVSVEGRNILLNGEVLKIKGVNRYDEIARLGPTPDKALIEKDLKLIKDTGINLIRTHYPQTPEFLSMLDELGLMIMEEIPINWWGQTWCDESDKPTYDILEPAEQALCKVIARDKNHPCIIAWSMANESATHTDIGIDIMKRLMRLAREKDPDRLLTFVVCYEETKNHQAFNDADIVCFNVYCGLGMKQGEELCLDIKNMAELVKIPTEEHLSRQASYFLDKPLLVTEFGARGIYGCRGNEPYSEDFQAAYDEIVWNVIDNDTEISGGVLWSWADYYHHRDLVKYAAFGPFGLVTTDRKAKKSLATFKRLLNK